MEVYEPAVIDLAEIEAVIFDMDGVVTDTARVHAAAWKHALDEFLRGTREPSQAPFSVRDDYLTHLDGRSRLDGIRSFLAGRGIEVPEGSTSDPPGSSTVHGIGAAKDSYFNQQVDRYGVAAFPASVDLLHALRRRGSRTAVASVSRNCAKVVASAGVARLFDTIVDGVLAAELGLAGTPGPAMLLEAARRLPAEPARAAAIAGAVPGVQAARHARFALVIGVGPEDRLDDLRAAGADVALTGLAGVRTGGRVAVAR